MSQDDLSPPNSTLRGKQEAHSSIVKERLGRLNAVELPAKMLYRNDRLLPETIKDIFPAEGETMTFPFLTGDTREGDASNGIRFAVREEHSRSAYLGECDVVDEFGDRYVYMDVKGMGESIYGTIASGRQWYNIGEGDPRGILTHGLAVNDKNYSELFARAGIGGHRVAALFEYLKLPTPVETKSRGLHHVLVTTKTLRKRGEDKEEEYGLPDRAVGAVRMFKEIRLNAVEERELLQLFRRLNARFSINLNTTHDYGMWLAQQLGHNLAIMHKLGCTHKYLSDHNVLADGTFIDDDSVTGPEDYGLTQQEIFNGAQLLDKEMSPRHFGRRKEFDKIRLRSNLGALMRRLKPHDPRLGLVAENAYEITYRNELKSSRLSLRGS